LPDNLEIEVEGRVKTNLAVSEKKTAAEVKETERAASARERLENLNI
jgi:hypothetical protein